MNRNSLKISVSFLFLAAILFAVSCKKNDDPKTPTNSDAAENNAFAEAQYSDVAVLVDQSSTSGTVAFAAAGNGSGSEVNGPQGPCVTVTVDTTVSPRSIIIDFGSTNCLCLDGRNRRGKIIATYTGQYLASGTVINISFDNYYVNENKISGTKKITNQGNNQAGNLVYKMEVNGQVVKANNLGTYTWVSTRYREWKAGALTPLNILDDVYGITGNASGVNTDGRDYSIVATQELVRKMNCRWFESGTLELTQTGIPKITLDYGSTGCDANATINILGTTYPVILQ
jgi:hypothetical protein